MALESFHAHLQPLTFPYGYRTAFSVVPDAPGVALPPGKYLVRAKGLGRRKQEVTQAVTVGDDGALRFDVGWDMLGEVLIDVTSPTGRTVRVGSVYGVDTGLAGRLPLRGDFHTHTWYSDGRSSPRELLQAAWALGLDFVAVTDHDNYAGCQDALANGADLPITVVPGEEVSFDRGHIVAVGTRSGVAERRRAPEAEARIAELEAGFRRSAEHQDLVGQLALSHWVAETIRDLGGLSILAHPYWVTGDEYHLDERLARILMTGHVVDAVELIGDVLFEENMLSLALYTDLASQGWSMPVTGNSDTHGIEHTLGYHWTIAFADGCRPEAIIEAVRAGRSVACTQLPGEQLRIYGPAPLVQYAYFLARRYFPTMDALHAAHPGSSAEVIAAREALLGWG